MQHAIEILKQLAGGNAIKIGDEYVWLDCPTVNAILKVLQCNVSSGAYAGTAHQKTMKAIVPAALSARDKLQERPVKDATC